MTQSNTKKNSDCRVKLVTESIEILLGFFVFLSVLEPSW